MFGKVIIKEGGDDEMWEERKKERTKALDLISKFVCLFWFEPLDLKSVSLGLCDPWVLASEAGFSTGAKYLVAYLKAKIKMN